MFSSITASIKCQCFLSFQERQLIVVQSSESPFFCGQNVHSWSETRVLIHYSVQGEISVIGPRIDRSRDAFSKLCPQKHFCMLRWSGHCSFAHSFVERDLWCVERDMKITRDQIVEEVCLVWPKVPCTHVHSTSHLCCATQVTAIIFSYETSTHWLIDSFFTLQVVIPRLATGPLFNTRT